MVLTALLLSVLTSPTWAAEPQNLNDRLTELQAHLGARVYLRVIKHQALPTQGSVFFDPAGAFFSRFLFTQADASGTYIDESDTLTADSYKRTRDFENEFNRNPSPYSGLIEAWIQSDSGAYTKVTDYPVMTFTGVPGPKRNEGDLQSPEGFYGVCPGASAVRSDPTFRWKLLLSYPNAFDLAHRAGAMNSPGGGVEIHGGAGSVGCFAIGDKIDDLKQLVQASLQQNRECVPVHVFPFRMTDENLARFSPESLDILSDAIAGGLPMKLDIAELWRTLKQGYDAFDPAAGPPAVRVLHGEYQVSKP